MAYNANYNYDTSYSRYNSNHAYHESDYGSRNDAPLPPHPANYTNSPFDDQTYPYSHATPSQSYSGVSGRSGNNQDPFDDENSIPLNGRKSKYDQQTTAAHMMPHQMEDPFVRDADPNRPKKKRKSEDGWFRGKITWVVYFMTTVQLIVFIAQLARNGVLTGTPIQIKPSFNPMIGPSPYVLINMGARYQPCMHNMRGVQDNDEPIRWPCPNATSLTGDSVSCSLKDLCGFSGNNVVNPELNGSIDDTPAPNQWWRFIIPIFLHAGIIHIVFNLLLQLTLGRDVEKLIGSVRFALLYLTSGIFGFVLGGNFAATGIASTGASGSLFGILAILLLDLLYNWSTTKNPLRDLAFIALDIVIAFILGLLPGLDNFSHIGGFFMGLIIGICILRSPTAFSRRTDTAVTTAEDYSLTPNAPSHARSHSTASAAGLRAFVKSPLAFFQNRRAVWWVWWLVRVAMLLLALVFFILLLRNFYEWRATCGWCKYLSCLPVTVGGTDWCSVGNLFGDDAKS